MFVISFTVLVTLLSFFSHAFALSYLPLSTSGRDIIDNANNTVTYAGINWPGHIDAMIPEGLQYQSIEDIVSKIKSVGFNVVRLTFAVEMVDQIIEGGDVSVQTSFVKALGDTDGGLVWKKFQERNPGLGDDITRLGV